MLRGFFAAVAVCGVGCASSLPLRPDVVELETKLREGTPAPFWSIPLQSASADILERISDDAVIVGALSWDDKFATFKRGPLRAIDTRTGAELWVADKNAIPNGQSSVIAVDPGIVITTATAEAWVIASINRDSGKTLWTRSFGRRAGFARAIVLGRPALIVANEGSVHAIELTSGTDFWNARMASGQSPLAYSVWLSEPAVYVVTDRVQRYALDSGRAEWMSADTIDAPVTQTLLAGDQLLTIGATGISSVSTFDGHVTWHHAREGLKAYYVTPLSQQLLVAWRKTSSSIASELTLLNPIDGRLVWHSEPMLELRGGPLIDEDGFIVVTSSVMVLRLDPRTGAVATRGKLPVELVSK
ncbi:MAG: PQQ-binding-like beta-propeller repeat protein, partial [Clostridia bacterium]|nr:PQQ-binding-like beta-propeller repeat protein [Deltaproteobacteria bacterium]